MAGVNIGNLSPELLDEFLEDHKTEINPLLSFEEWADVKDVDTKSGDVQRWLAPLEIPEDSHRSTEHAFGEAPPRQNISYGTISYLAKKYGLIIDIEEEQRDELETYDDVSNKVVKKTVLKTLFGFNDIQLAEMLRGNGTSGNDRDLTEFAVSNPWNGASGTIIKDIDDKVQDLRGAGQLQAVIGFDIAQIMSRAAGLTGSDAGSGREYINMQAVRTFMRERGVSQVIIDGTVVQDGEPGFTRSYKGVYDGVFYLGTVGNIMVQRYRNLRQKMWTEDNTDVISYKTTFAGCARRAYAEHGYYFTGLTS